MADSPRIYFMNPGRQALDWFYRGRSRQRAEELGWDIWVNQREEPIERAEWAEIIADAEALLTTWGSPRVDDELLAGNDSLQIIGHVGGSVAPYIADEVFDRGVRVCTANTFMARSCAEHCMMLMLMGTRRAHEHIKLGTRSEHMVWFKDWELRVPQDLVIGIWGFGDIASWLLSMLLPFEPKEILVASSHLSDEDAAGKGMRKVEFDALFEQADVVFTLAGMTVENTGRVGPKQLAALKDGAVLINIGRAPLIQPDALLAELRKGRWTGIFDVFEKEPLPEDHPFNELPNVILSPHYAGTGRDSWYMAEMLDEIDRFRRGEELRYEVFGARARRMTDMGAVRDAQKKQEPGNATSEESMR